MYGRGREEGGSVSLHLTTK